MLDSENAFHKAQYAAELGDYEQARKILMELLRADPNNRNGWLLMAEVVTKPEHAVKCLERVLALEPGNETARLRLAELTVAPAGAEKTALTSSSWAYQDAAPITTGGPVTAEKEPASPAMTGPWTYQETAAEAVGEHTNSEVEPAYPGSSSPWAYVEASQAETAAGEEQELTDASPAVWETPAFLPPAAAFQKNAPTGSPWAYVDANPAAALAEEADEQAGSSWESWQPAEAAPKAVPDTAPAFTTDWMAPQRPAQQPPAKKRGARWEMALIAVLALTAACILGLVLVPKAAGLVLGSAPAAAAAPPHEAILGAIDTNIVASNREDFDLYMSTIHSQSPAYSKTAETLEAIFSQYDLSYEISGLEVLQASSREARVAFVLVTRKLRGPDFRNNRIQGEMTLRPEDGAWKIYNQKVDTVEYLD